MTRSWSTAYLAALTAADDPLEFMPAAGTFVDVTIRQHIRVRSGGRRLRVEFSNEFGDGPLELDEVRVSGADGPQLPMLLDGRPRWRLAPGQRVAGDPVDLSVAADDELTVTVRVVGRAPAATYLHSAQRTAHIAGASGETESTSAYWLSRVLVDTAAHPVVVAVGDSLTRGDGTTVDRDQRYPDHLQRRLRAAGSAAAVLNAGIGGNRLLRPRVGPALADRLDRDVLSAPGVTQVIVMAGLNDLGLPALLGDERPSADELFAGLMAVAGAAASRGVQPVIGTITPFGGSAFESFRAGDSRAVRVAVNARLRAQRQWPVADFAAAVADPDDADRVAPAYDAGDGVHLNDAGASRLAAAVRLDTLTTPGGQT